jgi:hypothetical protein
MSILPAMKGFAGLLFVGLVSISVWGASPAEWGVEMADVQSSFAPLYGLYDAYAGYLFTGTPPTVPAAGVESVCGVYQAALETLQLELIQEAAVDTTAVLSPLVRLRVAAKSFCLQWADSLVALSAGDSMPGSQADVWASEGFFVAIHDMEDLFAETLDALLDAAGEAGTQARWELAVAFSARAIVDAPQVESISSDVGIIFFGGEEADRPPFDVPSEVAESMALLVGLSGRELGPVEQEAAHVAASVVCEGLMRISAGTE